MFHNLKNAKWLNDDTSGIKQILFPNHRIRRTHFFFWFIIFFFEYIFNFCISRSESNPIRNRSQPYFDRSSQTKKKHKAEPKNNRTHTRRSLSHIGRMPSIILTYV